MSLYGGAVAELIRFGNVLLAEAREKERLEIAVMTSGATEEALAFFQFDENSNRDPSVPAET